MASVPVRVSQDSCVLILRLSGSHWIEKRFCSHSRPVATGISSSQVELRLYHGLHRVEACTMHRRPHPAEGSANHTEVEEREAWAWRKQGTERPIIPSSRAKAEPTTLYTPHQQTPRRWVTITTVTSATSVCRTNYLSALFCCLVSQCWVTECKVKDLQLSCRNPAWIVFRGLVFSAVKF